MEVVRGKEGEGETEGTLMALGSTGFLTQEKYLGGPVLIDARNGFNKFSCLAMLWTVQHIWTEGEKFALNCYKHWEQLILHHLEDIPVSLLIWEEVTQGDPI